MISKIKRLFEKYRYYKWVYPCDVFAEEDTLTWGGCCPDITYGERYHGNSSRIYKFDRFQGTLYFHDKFHNRTDVYMELRVNIKPLLKHKLIEEITQEEFEAKLMMLELAN